MRRTASLLLSLPLALGVASCAPQASSAPQGGPAAEPGAGGQPRVLDLANRPAVPGITRTTLRDDARVTVTRVHFAPGAAEPIHSHATELMIIPIRSGKVDWIVEGKTTPYLEVGALQTVAAGVPHQLANTGTEPFEIIAVTVK